MESFEITFLLINFSTVQTSSFDYAWTFSANVLIRLVLNLNVSMNIRYASIEINHFLSLPYYSGLFYYSYLCRSKISVWKKWKAIHIDSF